MISQVQFGNIFNSGGKTVVGGSSSGYDTAALVKGLADAKRLPATKLEDQVKVNDKQATAFTELSSIMTKFSDAANFLRNPPGVANQADDIFKYRTAALTSNTSIPASNYLGMTVEPGATLAQYNITVDSLATQNVKTTNNLALVSLDDFAVGAGRPMTAGTITLGASQVAVTISDGDTLRQVVQKINSVSSQSGVEATTIKVADGQYRLQLKTSATGTSQNYANPDPAVFTGGFGLVQNATDAQLTVDGTQVTRSQNSINDLFDKVTFNLLAKTPGGTTLDAKLQPDTEVVKAGITNLVNAYNDFRIFAAKQGQLGSDGKPTADAILASNGTLRNVIARVYGEMNATVAGITGGNPARLSDIGITFKDFPGDDKSPLTKNILQIDDQKLTSALSSNFEGVRQVFEFDFASSNSQVQIYQRSNSTLPTNFALSIDPTTSTYNATFSLDGGATTQTIALDASAVPGGGFLLKGQTGSALNGLQMIYSGSAATTSSITLSQGLGDRMYNALDTVVKADTGMLAVEQKAISDKSARAKKEVTRIDDMVERFRQSLLEKFSNLEKAVSSVNTILNSLNANTNAKNNNNG